MNKIQRLAEVVQAAAKRLGIENSSASIDIGYKGGPMYVHVSRQEFDEYFPPGAGEITDRKCDVYPFEESVTSNTGIVIFCLRKTKREDYP